MPHFVQGPSLTGSPPHACGEWTPGEPRCRWRRFTPTCVGKIASYRRGHPPRPVHPHMRGDNPSCASAMFLVSGSPPHAWGQYAGVIVNDVDRRFTPTCVGTIRGLKSAVGRVTVHPHMRGDNGGDDVGHVSRLRFTPTCVGTMARVFDCQPLMFGSPPHAWGQMHLVDLIQFFQRFTPTCVGTMFVLSIMRSYAPVHPTCVGTISHGAAPPQMSAVHPHMRGDNGRPARP